MRVGAGLSLSKDHIQAAREAVTEAKRNLAYNKIDLALVFSSLEYSHALVFQTITNLLGNIPILGSSSLAIISNNGVFKHGLAVLLISLNDDVYFNAALVRDVSAKSAASAGRELGEKLMYGFKGVRRNLSLIFSDGLIPDCANLVLGLQEQLGKSFPLLGASASGNVSNGKTYTYFNHEVITNSACGILWGGKLNFGIGVKHGWKPLGKPHQVSRSQGNVVNEIDGQSASIFYEEYFDKDINSLRKELKQMSLLYPLGICVTENNDYLLRSLTAIQDDGSVVFNGNVPEGSTVRLMIGSKESCLQATKDALEAAKSNLTGRKIALALIFDSISRFQLLGRNIDQELNIIKESLGEKTPILGIYTNAEQAPLSILRYLGGSYLHNNSISILTVAD